MHCCCSGSNGLPGRPTACAEVQKRKCKCLHKVSLHHEGLAPLQLCVAQRSVSGVAVMKWEARAPDKAPAIVGSPFWLFFHACLSPFSTQSEVGANMHFISNDRPVQYSTHKMERDRERERERKRESDITNSSAFYITGCPEPDPLQSNNARQNQGQRERL